MKFKAEIGHVPQLDKTVAVVQLEAAKQPPKTSHTVLVLDCSTSMTDYLEAVRHDSQRYVAELGKDEYVSIIIFSGHGTAKLIAGPTQCTDTGRELVKRAIEKEVRPIGTTVFSEPLNLTLDAVRRLSGEGTAHNAVLFTDGCAVPTAWDVPTEESRALGVACELRDFGAVVSVVGYGVHYNPQFLSELMRHAGNTGVFRHISEISEFGPAIQSVREVFTRTSLVGMQLLFRTDKGLAGSVYRSTPEVFLAGEKGAVSTRGAYDNKVTFFIEVPAGSKSLTISGSVDRKDVTQSLQCRKLSPDSAADYLRVLAADAFLHGQRERAIELLKLTEDAVLADKAESAYSDREQREAGGVMRAVFRDRRFIGGGLKPAGPSRNALNVLRTLIEGKGNVVYIPKGAYKRSTELTTDPRVLHPANGRTLKVVRIQSNESRFNFSLLALKDVRVRPVFDNGEIDSSAEPTPAQIWRTYNVILDGNLWLPELEAQLGEESFSELYDAGVIENGRKYKPDKVYPINLRNVRLVSPVWAQPATLGLVTLLREEKELEAEQKALNARRKATASAVTAADFDEEGEGMPIYREQGKKVEGMTLETYQAPCCELRLMGYKPKDYQAAAARLCYEHADRRVKEVRQRLAVVRFISRAVTFAMEVTGSKAIKWGDGKETKRGKYPKLEQTAQFDGAELKRVTWKEACVCS